LIYKERRTSTQERDWSGVFKVANLAQSSAGGSFPEANPGIFSSRCKKLAVRGEAQTLNSLEVGLELPEQSSSDEVEKTNLGKQAGVTTGTIPRRKSTAIMREGNSGRGGDMARESADNSPCPEFPQ
jgi:hypothetical protein